MNNINQNDQKSQLSWIQIVSKYNFPEKHKSIWQLINSVLPFLLFWILAYHSLEISYWLSLVFIVLAAAFSVRIFIIFHDCGHNSFFRSVRWNTLTGMFLGLFSFTPFYKWQRSHDGHHQTVGNLDKRGIGDVITLTVEEYKSKSPLQKLFYRLYRNPAIMFIIGGFYIFIIQNRFTNPQKPLKERINVHLTTLVLAVIIYFIGRTIGFKEFIMIELPILWISSAFGISLFYIQHQFEDVIWRRNDQWDYKTMALEGSSFFKLPRILQWFSGNIGFHHLHHLSPRIPNYKLEDCLIENPQFQVNPITIKTSFSSLKVRLWDEMKQKTVSFRDIK